MFCCLCAPVPAPLMPELAFTEFPPSLGARQHPRSTHRIEENVRRFLVKQHDNRAILERCVRSTEARKASSNYDRTRGRHGGALEQSVGKEGYGGDGERIEYISAGCVTHVHERLCTNLRVAYMRPASCATMMSGARSRPILGEASLVVSGRVPPRVAEVKHAAYARWLSPKVLGVASLKASSCKGDGSKNLQDPNTGVCVHP